MKQILIDSFNVMHAIPHIKKHIEFNGRLARDKLIEYILICRREKGLADNNSLIFDGDDEFIQNTIMVNSLKCIFYKKSKGSADAYNNDTVSL